jgi:FtsP/CotA-like multicopper oxidase with cupredoxin domain
MIRLLTSRRSYVLPFAMSFLCICFFLNNISAQDFPNKLPIPYLIESDTILLEMSEHMHSFNPGDTAHYLYEPIRAFAFNEVDAAEPMTILGPSIAWNYGASLHNEVTNNIDRVSTTHWHGAHVPQYADGGPHQKIQVGDTWKVGFEVLDKSATMWYHPHAIDITYEQVQMGLSGMIYVEDPPDGVGDDAILTFIHSITPHDYNKDDFPLIFQTKKFAYDTANMSYRIQDVKGFKDGYEYLVNGVMNPYLDVPANVIRLRVLNGDGKFTFNLGVGNKDFEPASSASGGINLIATDAGYTDQSYYKPSIYMAPGERTEWLLDLRGKEGDTLYVYNKVSEFPNDGSIIGDTATTNQYATDKLLLKLIVGPPDFDVPISPIIGFPIPLHPLETPEVYPWTKKRIKTFYRDTHVFNCDTAWVVTSPPNGIFTIDHEPMSLNCVNDVVLLDSTEIWEIVNTTQHAHPFHIHDIHFWVVDGWNNITGEPINKADWPQVFSGPKDNVLVLKNWTLQLVATFNDFGTPIAPEFSYMFHCHILPHEDRGMMGQFVVWDGSTTDVEDGLDTEIRPKLYPNPTNGQLYLEADSKKESQIRIFNVQGQLLKLQRLAPFIGQTELSVSELPPGLIYVEWMTDKGRFVSKVVVQ